MRRLAIVFALWASVVGSSMWLPDQGTSIPRQSLTVAGTPVATHTATVTLTPSPTSTSYRVVDVSVRVEDSRDLVWLGQEFYYVVHTYTERSQVGVEVQGGISPHTVRLKEPPFPLSQPCDIDDCCFRCHDLGMYSPNRDFYIGAEVVDTAPEGHVTFCVDVWGIFWLGEGGHDPNPDNNHDCEDTTVLMATPEVTFTPTPLPPGWPTPTPLPPTPTPSTTPNYLPLVLRNLGT